MKRNSKLLLLREKIQAKFQVFAADEEAPVCLCGRINFGSVLRRGTTLRGAAALTDFEHTALLFVEKPPHSKNAKFPKNTLVGQVWLFRSFPNNYEVSCKFVKEHTSVF